MLIAGLLSRQVKFNVVLIQDAHRKRRSRRRLRQGQMGKKGMLNVDDVKGPRGEQPVERRTERRNVEEGVFKAPPGEELAQLEKPLAHIPRAGWNQHHLCAIGPHGTFGLPGVKVRGDERHGRYQMPAGQLHEQALHAPLRTIGGGAGRELGKVEELKPLACHGSPAGERLWHALVGLRRILRLANAAARGILALSPAPYPRHGNCSLFATRVGQGRPLFGPLAACYRVRRASGGDDGSVRRAPGS